ncbi:MAG: GNAT family N-acetyltransferase, partial [Proteobacteria bacterium]|nr:GNAT family N-acetyltransferase [Pseudomonadota bacterium]
MILDLSERHVPAMSAIINQAARAYAGAIPADRYHEPYMPLAELYGEIAAGVRFSGFLERGSLLGVMGIQDVGDVTLIRHAYVSPGAQRKGVGRALLSALAARGARPLLVGTWADAHWAVGFYEKNGFTRVGVEEKNRLLATYWSIPKRQVETSVVLARQEAGPASPRPVRPLGDMEYTYWLMDLTSRANFVFCAELSGGLDPRALEKALVPWTRAYPLLGTKIVEHKKGAMFVPVPEPVPLRTVRVADPSGETLAGPGDPLVELLQEEHVRPFALGQGPLARAVLA